MATYKTIDELLAALSGVVFKSLETEVAEVVKREEQEAIQKYVYDVYEPIVYERRGERGDDKGTGLGSIESMEVRPEGGMSISIINTAKPNLYGLPPPNLAELVEYGHGSGHGSYSYTRGRDYPFMHPRPFTEKTVEGLQSSQKHIEALKKSLRKKGVIAK